MSGSVHTKSNQTRIPARKDEKQMKPHLSVEEILAVCSHWERENNFYIFLNPNFDTKHF